MSETVATEINVDIGKLKKRTKLWQVIKALAELRNVDINDLDISLTTNERGDGRIEYDLTVFSSRSREEKLAVIVLCPDTAHALINDV